MQLPDANEHVTRFADSFPGAVPDLSPIATTFMTQDDSRYTAISASGPAVVEGADSAVMITASFVDDSGATTYDEYAILAPSGSSVYVLDPTEPDAAVIADPDQVQSILGSFTLTRDAATLPQVVAAVPQDIAAQAQTAVSTFPAPAPAAPAPVPNTSAPPGATALCNDGTHSSSAHRGGTCSHQGGVAQFLLPLPP